MASGKHSRSKRKRKRPKSQNVPAEVLLNQVRQLLDNGDGRGALDRLRQAQHGDGGPQEGPLLRFCACIERTRQLAQSGLEREAAAMHAQAALQRESISLATVGDEDLVRYVRRLDGADALAVYATFLIVRPASLRAERSLADLLVIHRCWDGLDVLDASHPLRRDAGPVMQSVDAMDAGEWERVAAAMQGVPRRSPFAPWRVFCKAMVQFRAGDDDNLRRTIALLPADFALANTVAEWRRICTGEGEGGSVQVRQALGTAGTTVEALGNELCRALRNRERARVLERLMTRLADALYPEDPLQARIDLLQIAALTTLRIELSVQTVHALVRRLVPPERVAGLSARIGLLLQQVSFDLWDPAPAAALLDRLPIEFPRAEDQALARARVLEALARIGQQAVQPEFLPRPMVKPLSGLLGGQTGDRRMLFVDLMLASLEADPDNREGYRFVLDQLRGRRDIKPRIRSVLEQMATRFPDDPDPWLELTTLHYSSNAYRRAEQTLAEARRRAPHDERILDLQAVGFLRSADQSRKGGRFELAARDLQRAEDLGRRKLAVVLRVKRMLLELVLGGRDAAEVVEPHLERLAPAAQLRTLVLLLHDLQENRHVRNVGPEIENAVMTLLARRAPVRDRLDAGEVVDLLAPLPLDLFVIYKHLHVAPVLAAWWDPLMRNVDGDRLLAVFDILMECRGHAPIRAEISRRLGGVNKTRRDPLLLLYLAVIRHLEGHDRDSRRFVEVLQAADSTDLERLREAATRLARHAHGILREALQRFDFTLLELPPPMFGDGDPHSLSDLLDAMFDLPDPESEPEPDPSSEASLDEFLDALRDGFADASPAWLGPHQQSLFDSDAEREVGALEELIDRHALRGMPASLLQELAGNARAEPDIRHNLDRIARSCEAADLRPGLTREARVFLFPRRRGRRRR